MSSRDQLAAWRDQLAQLLEAVADLTGALGVVHSSGELHPPEEQRVAGNAEVRAVLAQIVERVQRANAAAERLLAADPGLADVAHPLLSVPGEQPIVDLRPWWSKLLDRVSNTAKRATLAQVLETLRLEADAALLRVGGRLARTAPPAT